MKQLRKFKPGELDDYHHLTIREIGHRVGVKAPTMGSKEEVIEKILKVQRGEVAPVHNFNMGAPRKIKVNLEDDFPELFEEVLEPRATTVEYPTETYPHKFPLNDCVPDAEGGFYMTGTLEILSSGYGFLRTSLQGISLTDVYISQQNIRRLNLRKGDCVRAYAKKGESGEQPAFKEAILINGYAPSIFQERKNFDKLTPCYPDKKIKLEYDDEEKSDVSIRCIDLFAPIGFGQRGLIVAPPKTGKTTLLKNIAKSIEWHHPEAKLFVLLIDERPEEVTDFKQSVSSEVIFSTFDEKPEHHLKVAEHTLNSAKRLVEVGVDVIILVDSITKLTRASNAVIEPSGRTLTGGLDMAAFNFPKMFFGAARNIQGGGSLTIISTALVETGSRMDDVIFEEFKGTGNMEVYLSRQLAEKRIFPAIDIYKSGTRKEEKLLSEQEYKTVSSLRRILFGKDGASENVIDTMYKTKNNEDFMTKSETFIKLNGK